MRKFNGDISFTNTLTIKQHKHREERVAMHIKGIQPTQKTNDEQNVSELK